jgi:hypothetical protein
LIIAPIAASEAGFSRVLVSHWKSNLMIAILVSQEEHYEVGNTLLGERVA